jgi:hypothetical protein
VKRAKAGITGFGFGLFFYNHHLLEHEYGGMMGLIRVDPGDSVKRCY